MPWTPALISMTLPARYGLMVSPEIAEDLEDVVRCSKFLPGTKEPSTMRGIGRLRPQLLGLRNVEKSQCQFRRYYLLPSNKHVGRTLYG